jgi:hypothetical protein
MTDEQLDREIRALLVWQADDVTGAPSAAEMATRIGDRAGRAPTSLRGTPSLAWIILAGLVTLALLAALATGAIQRPDIPILGLTENATASPAPTSSPTEVPSTAPATAEPPSPTAAPAAAGALPPRTLPGPRGGPPREYGWQGESGDTGGMHRVVGGQEAVAIFFRVGSDCLDAPREQQRPVQVAGFDGVVVEPYMPPMQFSQIGDEITRAYALSVGGRILCLYITWHPTTSDAERQKAEQIVDGLRAQRISEDVIRINITLVDGWDTG